MFVYELRDCGFESRCSHLNFRYCACFERGVPWHSGNYIVWIHSEMRTWHHNNIQSNAPYRYVLTPKLNHLASLAKWLSVLSQTTWLRVWVPLQSFLLQISRLFWARSSLTFIPWHSTIECGYTLKRVRDMIKTYNPIFFILKYFFNSNRKLSQKCFWKQSS